jgi:LacI family transcriptional regulator
MKKYQVPIRPDWVVYGGFSEEAGYKGFMTLHAAGEIPDFVFAVTFPVALGVYRAVEELKLKIPDDVDIISFGNSGLNQFLSPPMSFVEQPTRELGKKALELTFAHIKNRDDFIPQHIKLPTRLVLCDTCIKQGALAGKRT